MAGEFGLRRLSMDLLAGQAIERNTVVQVKSHSQDESCSVWVVDLCSSPLWAYLRDAGLRNVFWYSHLPVDGNIFGAHPDDDPDRTSQRNHNRMA